MSILQSIFGTSTPAPVAQAAPVAAPVTTPPNQGNIPATVTDPTVVAPAENVPETPLAQFDNLWSNEPKAGEDGVVAPAAPLTQEDITKAVAGANFTRSITPEQMQAVAAGGEDAMAAMQAMLNNVGRELMVQQTLVGNKLTDKAVQEALAAQEAKIPAMVRAQANTSHMLTENPLFNNPAIKPVAEATRTQLQGKYPDATPAEITKMTQDFLMSMGNAFAPTQDPAALLEGETDWTQFA